MMGMESQGVRPTCRKFLALMSGNRIENNVTGEKQCTVLNYAVTSCGNC